MDKNYFINAMNSESNSSMRGKIIKKFFEQNICIPKGVNRHKYADVIHAKAEDITIKAQFKTLDGWTTFQIYDGYEFRIKPYEPIYEWKYEIQTQGMCLHTAFHYTDDEAIIAVQQKYQYFEKMEETKQIRDSK